MPTQPPASPPPVRKAATSKGSATKASAAKASAAKSVTTRASAAKAVAKSTARTQSPRSPSSQPGGDGASLDRPWGGSRRGGGRRDLYRPGMRSDVERWSLISRLLTWVLSRPGLVLGLTGSREEVALGGRVLHRGVQALIQLVDLLGRMTGSDRSDDPLGGREEFVQLARLAMPVRTDVHVTGRHVPGPDGAPEIAVRVYRRFGVGVGTAVDEHRPSAIVFFHGGGWVVGDLDSHDASCRLLAAVTGCVVVAVDYRLAPEHPFPAAVEDCLAAYAWVQRNHEELGTAPGMVGVMGDSAGGNLAAVVALETRPGRSAHVADVPPPVAQGLVYPATDARLDSPSIHALAEGFFLTKAGMETYRGLYLPDSGDWEDVRASPLLADDHAGVAPAVIVTAGFDPLRDDGFRYAEALQKAGVAVDYRCYDDQIHGFFAMGIIPDSLALAIETCDAMGRLMRRVSSGA